MYTVIHSPTSVSLAALISLERKAGALQLLSGSIRSPLAGGHLSRLRGRGMEFDQVRRYQSGDDARAIDWKVTARKGAPYLKEFREERERPILLCIDYRQTMFFATRGALKSVIATSIAALYGWGGLAHGDRVGGLLFDDDRVWEQRPAKGRKSLLRLLHRCCHHSNWGETPPAPDRRQNISQVLLRLRRVTPTGSLVVIVSDGRGLDAACEPHLTALARHNAVLLLHITDPLEHHLPAGGIYPVHDGHAIRLIDGDNSRLRQQYAQQQRRWTEALQARCRRSGIHWMALSTEDDPLHKLGASGQP